jgi:hypothetical protein
MNQLNPSTIDEFKEFIEDMTLELKDPIDKAAFLLALKQAIDMKLEELHGQNSG